MENMNGSIRYVPYSLRSHLDNLKVMRRKPCALSVGVYTLSYASESLLCELKRNSLIQCLGLVINPGSYEVS